MPNDKDEITTLVEFLKKVKEILAVLVKESDSLPSELHKPLSNSWMVVEKKLDELSDQLSANKNNFLKLLKSAGLSGDEMKFKLTGFDLAYKLWNPKSISTMLGKKFLKNLLDWANVILSSLAMALPPPLAILADSIREFKDAIEAAINLKEIREWNESVDRCYKTTTR